MDKINQTCEENTDLFAQQKLYLNRERYQLLADERIKLNNNLINICYSYCFLFITYMYRALT